MHYFVRIFLGFLVPILSVGLATAQTADLPDTGQDKCDNGFNVMVACSAANSGDNAFYPRQDGRFGSDAKATVGTLVKKGAGAAGFDYTKVAYNGTDLPATAVQGDLVTNWSCTRDNITGLTWAVKAPGVSPSGYKMHATGNRYLWYKSDVAANGGNHGCPAGTCEAGPVAISCHAIDRCRTELYAQDVNATPSSATCGQRDWRVPTRRELLTLFHAGSTSGGVDATYFPNMSGEYWTDTSAVTDTGNAWTVSLTNGATSFRPKSFDYGVILVRGNPF